MLTLKQLKLITPQLNSAKAEQYLPLLQTGMDEFEINNPLRQAAYLAQLAHESVGLTAFEEFASGKAYEGREDLGNTRPGDGVRFKGRGPMQLTGRANYRAAGAALGLDLENNPQLASQPAIGFRTAAWFWKEHGLNELADNKEFDRITKRINGGYNGKISRDNYYKKALEALGG